MPVNRLITHLSVFLLTFIYAASASAQLIAYEPFDYADDLDIDSSSGNGGTGWADAWQQRGGNGGAERFTAQEGGLTYTDAGGNLLAVSGNYGLADFNGFAADDAGGGGNTQMFRDVAGTQDPDTGAITTIGDLVGGAGNSYYISFIGERRGASNTDALGSDPGYVNPHAPNEYSRNAHLSLTGAGGGEEAQLGNPSNQTTDTWKIRAKGWPGCRFRGSVFAEPIIYRGQGHRWGPCQPNKHGPNRPLAQFPFLPRKRTLVHRMLRTLSWTVATCSIWSKRVSEPTLVARAVGELAA